MTSGESEIRRGSSCPGIGMCLWKNPNANRSSPQRIVGVCGFHKRAFLLDFVNVETLRLGFTSRKHLTWLPQQNETKRAHRL